MTFINYASREINCKIVYYGPGLCGKTTNIQWIHEQASPEKRGKLVSLATETDRTLFFDFLPLDMGTVKGFKVRFHLYTVPGQVFYDASRKLILRGCDGVIFVADSQRARMEANIESIANLATNLRDNGFDIRTIPYVLQLNKRGHALRRIGGRDGAPPALPERAHAGGRRQQGHWRHRDPQGLRPPDPHGTPAELSPAGPPATPPLIPPLDTVEFAFPFRSSSGVERSAVNRLVGGSNPSSGAR